MAVNYTSARGRCGSAIALAALCFVLQENDEMEMRDQVLGLAEKDTREAAWEILQEMNSE